MKTVKRWFLKAVFAVIIGVACICVKQTIRIKTDLDKAQARQQQNEMIRIKTDLDKAQARQQQNEMIRIKTDLDKAQARQQQNEMIRIKTDLDKAQARQKQNEMIREQDVRINNIQQWLQNEQQKIEKRYEDARQSIPEQQQKIEKWYRNNLAILQRWRNAELERLNVDDKGATAEFLQDLNNTTSYTNGYISPDGYFSANTSSNSYSASKFNRETAYIADNRVTVENTYQEVLGNLQKQKSSYLNSVSEDSLQREKILALQEAEEYVENASKVAVSKKRDIITATEDRLAGGPGVVIEAIDYNNKKSFCMIEGDTYFEGNTIGGFKIHKISEREVIFEKNGKTFLKWLQ